MNEVLITLASSLCQLGVAVAAYKVAIEVKHMTATLKGRVDDHEERIDRLEGK